MPKPWEKLKEAFEKQRKDRARMQEFVRQSKDIGPVRLIVGLGNFGPEYERTRHNCGFMAVDALCGKVGAGPEKHRFKGVVREARYGDERLVILKPYTYMNNSGESVRQALDWYKLPEDRMIVIYDDCDLQAGAIRIRMKGSAGTHNGMKSVLRYTESEAFPRVRIGIGARPEGYDMVGFVLGHFSDEELPAMEKAFDTAADAALYIISNGGEAAMSRFNSSGASSAGSGRKKSEEPSADGGSNPGDL